MDTIGDIGKSELADPARYPKRGNDYSAWLDDVFDDLSLDRADMVCGSMGGWIGMAADVAVLAARVREVVTANRTSASKT